MNGKQVVKRNGTRVDFDRERIAIAVKKAFDAAERAIEVTDFDRLIDAVCEQVDQIYASATPTVEQIQDIVEQQLVAAGLYEVSKRYILYREKRKEAREREAAERAHRAATGKLVVKKRDGRSEGFRRDAITTTIASCARELETEIQVDLIMNELERNIFDGITTGELQRALILAVTAFIEKDPAYSKLAARLDRRRRERDVFAGKVSDDTYEVRYRESFAAGIAEGISADVFDARLASFDLERLAVALVPERDDLLDYLGIETLGERYFVRAGGRTIETPQAFWMRVAMGLAIEEDARERRAIQFYEVLSTLRFVASTPTLFHSGLTRPQLSSCYLSTVKDDLAHIFKVIGDNAQLSKWSGGIGNDWTAIRGTGSHINSTKVESQGVIPFLKIANDATVAINRSGKRRGATCAYLETWHLDIEDFLDLRRNTGDDRRRTHDMNTANWIPDLFMKRVRENGPWTLFSSDETPDLHEIYGSAFEERYRFYEAEAAAGRMHKFKVVEAVKLWRKMLTRLFETGHPWITFKDPSNIRSPQDHDGVVHNSNLCTEITLNNSESETAVCNLGSVNLARHTSLAGIDHDLLADTVETAMRMLDNVIDINFYPTEEARRSNIRHRPVGLGLMGFQDALFVQRMPIDSDQARAFADESMEFVAYHAILASSRLAAERGAYESYPGSKWDRGIFPLDTLDLLEAERGTTIPVPRDSRLDWTPVRDHVKRHGMRNSNTMAIAPTATISNIAGCFPCIEPIYKNIYVKANMSGEFTVVNSYLVRDLKARGLWNDEMLDQLKYHDGSLARMAGIPQELRDLYKEAFEVDPKALISLTALRGKWIDQSQSHNVFMQGASGPKLHEIYMKAWEMGLKTTYYLRTLAASQIEKSTLDAGKYGYTQKRSVGGAADEGVSPAHGADGGPAAIDNGDAPEAGGDTGVRPIVAVQPATAVGSACSVLDPDCEACQ